MRESISKELDMIKNSILEATPVEAIYLFGSHAYGQPKQDSDLDIYVVIPDSGAEDMVELSADIRGRLYKKKTLPMDLLIGKSSVFAQRRHAPATIEREVAQKGVRLYG